MSYKEAKILRDTNDNPIPQYYDPVADEFKPLQGSDGGTSGKLVGKDGKVLAVDGDNAFVASNLEEYYLDNGAYFKFGATEFLNVPAYANETAGQLQFELEHEYELIRIFSFAVSTLCDKYKMEIWETDTRDVSDNEEEGNITDFPPFQTNREKLKAFPGTLYKLEGDAEHDLSGAGYELVFSDAFIMEEAGGPQAGDAGMKTQAATVIQLAKKNYIFRILNYDDEAGGRDFAVGICMGVSDYLE